MGSEMCIRDSFLAGPPLVKAATGEEVTAEELGGADVHTSQSGVADHFAEDEPEALRMVRNIVENIGPRTLAPAAYEEPELPAHDVLNHPHDGCCVDLKTQIVLTDLVNCAIADRRPYRSHLE